MKLSCLASLATLFIALPAAAQPSTRPMGPGPMPVFADFDGNDDGRITEQEFIDARSKRIAERATEGRAENAEVVVAGRAFGSRDLHTRTVVNQQQRGRGLVLADAASYQAQDAATETTQAGATTAGLAR